METFILNLAKKNIEVMDEVSASISNDTLYLHAGQGHQFELAEDEINFQASEYAKGRLEELREELRDECISYDELAELASLKDYIEEGDVELLQAAGVPEKH